MGIQTRIDGKELTRINVDGQMRNLLTLRKDGSVGLFDAHPLVERINTELGTRLTVISHKAADVAFTILPTDFSLLPYACPVDASIAFERPGTRLGREIVNYEHNPRVVLATGKYRGELDVALVALGLSPVDFKKDGDSIVLDIPESRLIAVPNFPRTEGWYMPHEQTGVPNGDRIREDFTEFYEYRPRYLNRTTDSPYVGLVTRDQIPKRGTHHYGVFRSGDNINVYYDPASQVGVAAEVPERDVAKIQALGVAIISMSPKPEYTW